MSWKIKVYLHKCKSFFVILAGTLIVLGGCLFFLSLSNYTDTSKGLAYLKKQESKSVEELSDTLSQRRSSDLMGVDTDVFSLFKNYVIIGDSRALGFSEYGFLPETRVLASTGATIYTIDDYMSQIESLKPKNIYIAFGQNDMRSNLLNASEGYENIYVSQIQKILEVVPGARVYMNSILPASAQRQASDPIQERLSDYNKAIQDICKKHDYVYIDNNEICDNGNADIYGEDGIHFKASFYEIWAKNMLKYTKGD